MSKTLSERAVACKVWRWEPGMPDQHGRIYVGTYDDGVGLPGHTPAFYDGNEMVTLEYHPVLPDLTSDATRGWMMKFIREIHGEETCLASVRSGDGLAWYIAGKLGTPLKYGQISGDTQEEAMVLAMETRP